MIGIRADANKEIATGHIMRCISIANQLIKLGEEVIFIVSDLYGQELLEDNKLSYVCLQSDWRDKGSEISCLREVVEQNNIKVLLLDSYQATREYMNQVKHMVKLVYIDDLCAYEYPVDAIINDALDASTDVYPYAEKQETELWIGNSYIMLREEFCNKRICIQQKVSNVMLTTGGADQWQICRSFLRDIIEKELFKDVIFHVVVGKFFTSVEDLYEIQRMRPGIVIHENVVSMSEIMLSCDVAISAGGSTLNELCAMGIPAICFSVADNQMQTVQLFEERQLMISNGDVRGNTRFYIELENNVTRMINNYSLRREMSEREKSMIDGKGAYRIAQNMCKMKDVSKK
ncbi:MAG: UDP-2,4-diacetamido-2,4,6-trideoxy-beta-L-altropyranose hydrolase [Lachnospira sp.]|nr:UDP-2,4-diacetamido-2,4,6-trideoxy-beta-L-altropyranose hydrolase [Lachnospira sp.]